MIYIHSPHCIIWLLSICPLLSWTHIPPSLFFSHTGLLFSCCCNSTDLHLVIYSLFPFAWLTLVYPLGFSFMSLLQRSLCRLPQSSLGSQNSLCSQHFVLLAAFNTVVIVYLLRFLFSIWSVSSINSWISFSLLYFNLIAQWLAYNRSSLNIFEQINDL